VQRGRTPNDAKSPTPSRQSVRHSIAAPERTLAKKKLSPVLGEGSSSGSASESRSRKKDRTPGYSGPKCVKCALLGEGADHSAHSPIRGATSPSSLLKWNTVGRSDSMESGLNLFYEGEGKKSAESLDTVVVDSKVGQKFGLRTKSSLSNNIETPKIGKRSSSALSTSSKTSRLSSISTKREVSPTAQRQQRRVSVQKK